MVAFDTVGEESEGNNLEEEIAGGQVDEAEEEEHTAAEVEGEHGIPGHEQPRLAQQFLAYPLGHVAGTAVFLPQGLNEFLELRRVLLLLASIVNIRLEEILPETVPLVGKFVERLLLLLGGVQLAALLALEHEEVNLDVVVRHPLLWSHAGEARIEGQGRGDGSGDEHVLLCVCYAQKAELYRVVVVEAEHEGDVDGDEPGEPRHAVEDAPQAALLARQTCQLAVGAVQEVSHAEQQDTDEVEPKPLPALVIKAAVQEKDTAGGSHEHGGDGDGIGMDVELGKKHCQEIAERSHHAVV